MKIKILGTLMIVFGVFLFVGVASASTADYLQPASTITYNEDLTVNGTGRFNSVYIGETGVGGVTFFNGTIVNIDQWTPVTFGDDVRIDGAIWGGPHKGNANDQGLKIADTLLPALTDVNDIGDKNLRWKDIYYAGNLFGTNANLLGNLNVNGNIDLEGEVKLKTPKKEYVSINGGTCSGDYLDNINGLCYGDGTPGIMRANWHVSLPQNSQIVSFVGIVKDNDPGGDFTCNLYRQVVDQANANQNKIASISTSGSFSNYQKLEDNTISYENVDNEKYSYFIHCASPFTPSPNFVMAGFRITYLKELLD